MLWLLLECGANFNMQSHAGYTAMSYIKHLHHTDSESIMTNHIYRYVTVMTLSTRTFRIG